MASVVKFDLDDPKDLHAFTKFLSYLSNNNPQMKTEHIIFEAKKMVKESKTNADK